MRYYIKCYYSVEIEEPFSDNLTMCKFIQNDCRQEVCCCTYMPENLTISVECGSLKDGDYTSTIKTYTD